MVGAATAAGGGGATTASGADADGPAATSSNDSTAPALCTTLRPARRRVSVPLPTTEAVRASASNSTAVCSSTPMMSAPSGSAASIVDSRASPR